jgi:sucrose phosphorylase
MALVIKGVPGVYTHGALALANNRALVEKTGVNRDINRGVIDPNLYASELADPNSKRSLLRRAYADIILIRTRQRAFHPQGAHRILNLSPSVFSVLRVSSEGDQHLLSLINVTDQPQQLTVTAAELGLTVDSWHDLIGQVDYHLADGSLSIELPPYAIVWLTPREE